MLKGRVGGGQRLERMKEDVSDKRSVAESAAGGGCGGLIAAD